MKDARTHGTMPEQLAELLSVAASGSTEEIRLEEAQAALVAAFSAPLLLAAKEAEDGSEAARKMETVGMALRDPTTEVAIAEVVKAQGKAMADRGDTAAERAAGTVVYYAAIARALLSHNRMITRHSCRDLAKGMRNLADRTWVPDEVKALFRAAFALLEEHSRNGV
ncbi:MAG: hypothetical protein NTU94_00150 [Planctomycetota bacterium]|nr:hypothetical protein [Planctomycetota bacterium]